MVFPPQRPGMFGQMSPFQFPGRNLPPSPPAAGGNGLSSMLKGLLGSGKAALPQTGMPFSAMAQTGAGSTGGIAGSLQNIQQVLNMIESTTPMIKQYGPMVKNLPAMFRMMKALNSMESGDDESDNASGEESDEKKNDETAKDEAESESPKKVEDKEESNAVNTSSKNKKRKTGESVPLLYI